MRYRLTTALVAATVMLQVGAIQTAGSFASDSMQARPVALSDATFPPTEMVYLYPGASVTYAYGVSGYNCPDHKSWFTETSAYQWNGKALGPQHRSKSSNYFDYWVRPGHPHQRVSFDGITFRNHTKIGVLVAGWCEV